MSAHSGPKIFGQRDLLFAMDSKSPRSRDTENNILSDWVEGWTAGTTGSSTGFSQSGDGNSRVLDANPYGATTTVWDVSNQDASSNADGGWNSSQFNIDNTKMYRYSVWIRRNTIGNGSTYFGLRGYNSSGTSTGVTRRDTGAVNQTNPYFWSGGWSNTGQWKLLVAHVWPAGSGTGSKHPDSGFYDVNGNRIGNISRDYVWQSETAKALHRSYLYYSTNTSTNQQFWNPRVEIVEVPEATSKTVRYIPTQRVIKEGIGGRWNLKNKATQAAGVVGLRKVRPSSDGFIFTGGDDDQSVRIPLAGNFNKLEGTISAWVYPTSYSGSNGIFVNRDNTTQNSSDWLWIGMYSSGSYLYFRLGSTSNCCTNDLRLSSASSYIPLNTWTLVTCTWKSAGSSFIYINGSQVGTKSISAIPSTSPSTHGRIGLGHDSGDTGSWNGKIDQFKIYQDQLSADTIKLNYEATKPRYEV